MAAWLTVAVVATVPTALLDSTMVAIAQSRINKPPVFGLVTALKIVLTKAQLVAVCSADTAAVAAVNFSAVDPEVDSAVVSEAVALPAVDVLVTLPVAAELAVAESVAVVADLAEVVVCLADYEGVAVEVVEADAEFLVDSKRLWQS